MKKPICGACKCGKCTQLNTIFLLFLRFLLFCHFVLYRIFRAFEMAHQEFSAFFLISLLFALVFEKYLSIYCQLFFFYIFFAFVSTSARASNSSSLCVHDNFFLFFSFLLSIRFLLCDSASHFTIGLWDRNHLMSENVRSLCAKMILKKNQRNMNWNFQS